jgi:TolB-like protein
MKGRFPAGRHDRSALLDTRAITVSGSCPELVLKGAMLSVPGQRTLEDVLRSGTSLEPAEVVRIGVELGRALESAHAAGRRPSRLTARHVVLGEDGRLVLASPDGETRSAGHGESGSADDFLYAAPETLAGQHGTERNEVYSVGVLLYRLLTGVFPVSTEAVQQGRYLEAWIARDDLRGSGSRVPLPLAHVVERAIDPRPEARYATLEALRADLQEASRERHGPDGLLPRRLRPGAALAAVLAIAALAWLAAHSLPDRPVVAIRIQHHGGSVEAREIVDGMTIEMTRLLAQAQGLDVRAARPSPSGRYTLQDDVVFGSERHASFVVSGSVHGEPGAWRHVDASLVRVRDGKAIWTHAFSFVKGDIFAVQEEIAEAVVAVLQTPFAPGRRPYSTTPPLQERFLRARALQASGMNSGGRASGIFERVVIEDPEFVPASAALATTLGGVRSDSHELPALHPGMAAARKAHAKDQHLAEANSAMGLLSASLCQWSPAKAYFDESLKRDPSVTSTYIDYALSTLLAVRDTRQALDVLDDALKVDPMSLRVRSALAYVLVEHGEYDRAIEISRGVIQEAPGLAATQQTRGRALVLSGRASEVRDFSKGKEQWGYQGYMLAVQGRHAEAWRLADAHPEEPARQMLIYAGLKDVNSTVDALQRTARLNPWRARTWMARPEIAPVLNRDPRAVALKEQLHLPAGCGGG